MREHKVASTEEIDRGEGKIVEAGGLSIAVFNVDGEFYAISNRCVHKGGPLGEGFLHEELPTIDQERHSIHCPLHYWEFDLETGRSIVDSKKGIRTFDVHVSDGNVYVKI